MATREDDPLAFLDEEEREQREERDRNRDGGLLPGAGDFFRAAGGGLLQSGAGLVGLPGLALPGEDPFERLAEPIRERGEELGEESRAGELTGRIVGEGAQLLAGGAGVAKAGGKLAASLGGRAARGAVGIRRGLRAVQAADDPVALAARAKRLGAESAIFSPVDAAIGLQRSQAIEDLEPVEAVAQEIALGTAGGAAFEAGAAGVRTLAQAAEPHARKFARAARDLARARDEGRLPTEDEARRILDAGLHPSAQRLRALRGEALAPAASGRVSRPADDFMLDPENPIVTRAGGPITQGDEIVLFSRGDDAGDFVADPTQLGGRSSKTFLETQPESAPALEDIPDEVLHRLQGTLQNELDLARRQREEGVPLKSEVEEADEFTIRRVRDPVEPIERDLDRVNEEILRRRRGKSTDDGPIIGRVFEANQQVMNNLLDDGRVPAGLSPNDAARFRLPEIGEGFAEAFESAAELKGLKPIARGPRGALKNPDEFTIDRGAQARPALFARDADGAIVAELKDAPEDLQRRLTKTDETLAEAGPGAELVDNAESIFRREALPSKRSLSQRQADVPVGARGPSAGFAARTPVLHHVTTAADDVVQTGQLVAQGRGFGRNTLSGSNAPSVSFTTSRHEALGLKRDLVRAGKLVRNDFNASRPDDLRAVLRTFARRDARRAGLDDTQTDELLGLMDEVGIEAALSGQEPAGARLTILRDYLHKRDRVLRQLDEPSDRARGALLDPLLNPDPRAYRDVSERTVGVIGMPVRDLPDDAAIVRRFADPLSEVAVHGDVDVTSAAFISPHRPAPASAADGLASKANAGSRLTPEQIANRVGRKGTRAVLREMNAVSPEAVDRLIERGDLPEELGERLDELDVEEVRGFTKPGVERLLAEPGGEVEENLLEQFKRTLVSVVESEPERAGVPKTGRTVDELKEEARAIGSIEELRTNEALDVASSVASRNMLRNVNEQLTALHKAADEAVGLERERLDLLISRKHAVARMLAKLTGDDISEAALKLRMRREFAEAQRELDPEFWLGEARHKLTDRQFAENQDDIAREIRRLVDEEDREGLAKFIEDLEQPSLGRRAMLAWKAGLLTNPQTHSVNFTSNLVEAGMERLSEEPAAFVDYLLSLEPVARATGLGSLPRTTFSPTKLRDLRSTKRGLKLGADLARAVVTGGEPETALARRFAEVKSTLAGHKVDIGGRRSVPFKMFNDPDFLEAVGRGRTGDATNAFLDTYVNGVFKFLGAGDQMFKGPALDASLVRQAAMKAEQGDEATKAILERWHANPQSIPDPVVLQAAHEANVRTFQDETGFGNVFAGIQRLGTLGEVVVPFSRTMGAILTRLFEFGGYGVLKGGTRLGFETRRGVQEFLEAEGSEATEAMAKAVRSRRKAVKEIARGFTGPGLAALGYFLADQGLMTGNFPEFGTSERQTLMAAGMQERSVFLPAEITESILPGDRGGMAGGWYDVTRIAPGGEVLALGAIMHQKINDPNLNDLERYATPFLEPLKLVMNQPFAQGMRRVARAAQDPESAGQSLLLGFSSSVVPAGVGAAARTIDPTVREDEGSVFFRFLTRIPWVRKTRPPRLNVVGEPIQRAPGVVANLLAPGRVREAKGDPVLKEMARVEAGVPRLQRAKVRKRVDGQDVVEREPLEEFQRRQELVGRGSRLAAQQAIDTFTYREVLPALAEQSPLRTRELRRAYIEDRVDAVRRLLFREGAGSPRQRGGDAMAEAVVQAIE